VRIAPKRSVHSKRTPRQLRLGKMLFHAKPPHVRLAHQPPLDPIVALDEASSEIYSALLVEEEGAASSFRAGRS